MAWATVIGVGGSLLASGAGGGGGGAAPAAAGGPVTFTPTFGAVNLGPKYLGSDAVAAAPAIETKPWVRVTLWAIGGLVVVVSVVALLRGRKKG